MATVTQQERTNILKLVAGMFNAAPGKQYLDEFTNAFVAHGRDYSALAADLANTGAFAEVYPSYLTTEEFANKFLGTLNLAANDEAQAFVKDKVNAGESFAAVIFQALNALVDSTSADFADARDQLANKATVAEYYSVTKGVSSGDLATLQAVVAGVTEDPATVTKAEEEIEDPVVPGLTFTLNVGADTLSPNSAVAANKTTAGDDLIRGVLDNSLETRDSIDGGAGNDTIRANVSATAAASASATPATVTTTIQPLLKDVENVFLNATVTNSAGWTAGTTTGGSASVVFDATDSTGLKQVWSEGSTLSATVAATGATGASGTASLTFQNLKLGTEVGIKDTTSGATFAFAGSTGAADAATLNLADASGGAAVTIAAIENLSIASNAGALPAVTSNNVAVTAAQAETVTVTGAQALTLALTGANVKTIDSTGFEKALTLNFTSTANKALAINAGVGADTFNIGAVANGGKVTIDMGAGNDTLNISDFAFHSITTGEGKDTINFTTTGAGANHKDLDVSTAATLEASAVIVTDFTSGSDVLRVTNVGAGVEVDLTGTELSAVAASSNLLNAANAALQFADAKKAAAVGDGVVFQYGDSTYVLINEDITPTVGGLQVVDADDSLIKLAGVASVTAADIVIL